MLTWLGSLLAQWRAYHAQIDPNSKCPACGHRNGKLKCVQVKNSLMVERQCQVCGAKCYEPTVVKPEKWVAKELLAQQTERATS